jgi:hypothetical protein
LQCVQQRFDARAVSGSAPAAYSDFTAHTAAAPEGPTMNRTMPTEIRLLGLTPEQYTQLMEQAQRDAVRLRGEAIAGFGLAIASGARAALAALRRRLARAPGTHVQQA